MITQIKQYLTTNEPSDLPKQILSLPFEESFYIWKNVIFKLRNLKEFQYQIIIELFLQFQKNTFLQQINQEQEQFDMFICLTRIFRNFIQHRFLNYESELYAQLLEQANKIIIDKLLILGQSELIYQVSLSNGKLLELLQQQYYNSKKFIKFILLFHTKDWNIYNFNVKTLSEIILSIIFNAKLQLNCEQHIFNLIKTLSQQQDIFEQITQQWSSKDFIQNGALHTQVLVSNLIVIFLQNEFITTAIHQGIENRLMISNQFQVQRKCGIRVWKQFVKILNIHVETDQDLDDEIKLDEIQQIKKIENIKKQEQMQKQEDQEEQEEQEEQEMITVKSLYDSIMSLRSENKDRIRDTFKHLPYLIRKGLDIRVHGETLTTLLLLSPQEDEQNEKQRRMSLVALMVMNCEETAQIILNRYFGDECSLLDRHFILDIIKDAVQELQDNPQKYQVEKYDEYNKSNNQEFQFKQITTQHTEQKKTIITTNQSSRRWGHTKRIHEQLQIVQPYINQFHSLTQFIYFPLLIHSPNKHKFLLNREPLLMQNLLNTITVMLSGAANDIQLPRLVDEALDFLNNFQKLKETSVIQCKIKLLLKISIIVKQDVIIAYPLLIDKMIQQLNSLQNAQSDEQMKNMINLVLNSYRQLFDYEL